MPLMQCSQSLQSIVVPPRTMLKCCSLRARLHFNELESFAGMLDVRAAWRKSLGEERDLFSELIGDDGSPEKLAQENGF
jgi:hypothetical protein